MTTDLALAPGQILSDRYRLVRLLGKGGMGQVFLADDLLTSDSVALKSLQALGDATDRRRFEREVRALQKLHHPNIVELRELGQDGDLLFFTMDYHPGVSLEEVIEARGAVTETRELDWYLRVLIQVTDALGCLHERHLVHRDIKPANILLRVPGLDEDLPAPADWIGFDNARALLADFGLVKSRDADGSLTRTALGTPQYMAPEQIEASPAVDERSDLYSLGVLLYRLATGSLPYATLSQALSRVPARPIREFNPDLPELLESTIARLLHFEPFRRPADAREVRDLLRSVLDRKVDREGEQRVKKLAQPSFCGRTAELRKLKRWAAEAARGVGRWVTVQGDRGTGKSWLLQRSDLRSHALIESRVSYYSGRFTSRAPHGAVGELLESVLRHLQRHEGPEAAVQALGAYGRLIARLLPEHSLGDLLERCPPVEDLPELAREHLVETVVRVLTAGSEVDPRCLVLEDLHYANALDIEILRRLVLTTIHLPVLLITTYRSDAPTRLAGFEALLHEIDAEERHESIEMLPFTEIELRQMVESMFLPARAASPEFVAVLEERTDGVPLYAVHLINSLWNRRAISTTDRHWTVDPGEVRALPIPESTRSHFFLVLDELPAEDLRLLSL
ncbi:MAG: serine/threonine-protein kinase PknK, partial [Planctomycetes bacterium]|nr:serine/threonine-protein kinase PknK [Planctomycetota bacterium]